MIQLTARRWLRRCIDPLRIAFPRIDSTDAEGVLFAHGGVAGGHSFYLKDKKLRYTFNWIGTRMFDVVADTRGVIA